ncbi:hypothetical protein HanPSC8_Chr11g0451811 [Helianthus annuus]|nr:hypothetical protein HanPSC8_Chr11g0451811 [Helianthus annuus]
MCVHIYIYIYALSYMHQGTPPASAPRFHKMRLSGVTLFLLVVFIYVLMVNISSEGRRLQSSPQAPSKSPSGSNIDKLRKHDDEKQWGGCWKCW